MAPRPCWIAVSLGQLLQSNAENNGARFSAYASQTGDYGAIDVFAQGGRVIALLEDAWGFDTPAAPGEFAHAGAWDVSGATPAPLCLFDTFKMPAEGGAFDQLPSFTPFRATLAKIAAAAQPPLGVSTLRDMGQLRAETQWMLLNMPLVVSQQARNGGLDAPGCGTGMTRCWTRCLRGARRMLPTKPDFDRAFGVAASGGAGSGDGVSTDAGAERR